MERIVGLEVLLGAIEAGAEFAAPLDVVAGEFGLGFDQAGIEILGRGGLLLDRLQLDLQIVDLLLKVLVGLGAQGRGRQHGDEGEHDAGVHGMFSWLGGGWGWGRGAVRQ